MGNQIAAYQHKEDLRDFIKRPEDATLDDLRKVIENINRDFQGNVKQLID